MEKIVEVENIFFDYDGEYILKNINLTVDKGDFLAFVGPNGSGKSTLMKLLIGELSAKSGKIRLFKKDISEFKDWLQVGYISQQVRTFNQSFPATVKEVIAAGLYEEMGFFKILNRKLEEKVDKTLKLVDMFKYKNRQIGNLSGGQQQRVFIARTIVTEPELILLDEPMVGIDSSAQEEFINLINKLNKELGITIIMVSHDIHFISKQANKLACFSGQNVFLHNADELNCDLYLKEGNSGGRLIREHNHLSGGGNND